MSQALHRLYADADAFVIPTAWDISSWVALEAISVGVPVIATPAAGIPDIVEDEVAGLLISPGDARALASALERPRSSRALRDRLGRAARAHVEANFDARRNMPTFLGLVKSLVSERRASGGDPCR
jgi:glycogen(starch) synthase